jgi:catechol 2,3-dioxygenase-like lactoylglutathione lyase family enzyme
MTRIHIHVGVEKPDESIRFYSAISGAQPVKTKPDYAKWMLEYPRVNFAISTRASMNGLDHLVSRFLAKGCEIRRLITTRKTRRL